MILKIDSVDCHGTAHNRQLKDVHSFESESYVRFIAPVAEELFVCSSLGNELLATTRYAKCPCSVTFWSSMNLKSTEELGALLT